MQLTTKLKQFPKLKLQGVIALLIYVGISASIANYIWMDRTVSVNDPAYLDPSRLEFKANNGDAQAQYLLGMLYFSGHSVQASDQKAIELFKRSAHNGHVDAQFQLCNMLETIEPKYAFQMCQSAASKKHVEAMAKTGYWFLKGPPGEPPNGIKGAMYLNNAAERGHSVAMHNLAQIHKNGAGVPEDLGLAYYWISLAALTEPDENVKANLVATQGEWGLLLKKDKRATIDTAITQRFNLGFKSTDK